MKTNNRNNNPEEKPWNKSITELPQFDGRVYVHLCTPALAKQFMQQAKVEGFTFCDGAKPTSRKPAEIMAVNPDRTINYIGTNGRIAYGCAGSLGNKKLIRIAYRPIDSGCAKPV